MYLAFIFDFYVIDVFINKRIYRFHQTWHWQTGADCRNLGGVSLLRYFGEFISSNGRGPIVVVLLSEMIVDTVREMLET